MTRREIHVAELIAKLRTDWFGYAGPCLYMNGAEAVIPLIEVLRGSETGPKITAVRSLGGIADVRSIEPLIEAINDPEIEAANQAAWELWEIAGRPKLYEPEETAQGFSFPVENFFGKPEFWRQWWKENRCHIYYLTPWRTNPRQIYQISHEENLTVFEILEYMSYDQNIRASRCWRIIVRDQDWDKLESVTAEDLTRPLELLDHGYDAWVEQFEIAEINQTAVFIHGLGVGRDDYYEPDTILLTKGPMRLR